MSIDKLLDELKEEERLQKMSENISERCWENIKCDIKIKQKWYDKLFLKIHNANKKYHLKAAFQLALAILIIASIPTVVKETKFYVNNSAFFNNLKQHDPNDNSNDNEPIDDSDDKTNKDDIIDPILDERPEYKETDQNYLNALEKVKAIVDKRYNNYSLYSTGQLAKHSNGNYYIVTVYDNAVRGRVPELTDVLAVNASSFEVYAAPNEVFDDNQKADKYFFEKSNSYFNETLSDSIRLLINKADNLNINGYDNIYSSIDLYVNLKVGLKNPNPKIPEDAYYFKGQSNIYYMYNEKENGLYRYNTTNGEKKLIYKYDPKEYSILTIEKKSDIDGDGKEDDIKFDPLRSILSINDVSIFVPRGLDFKEFNITDIYSKDNEKEIYIWYSGANDYSQHSIYKYKNGKITNLLTHHGTPVIGGSGKVTFKNSISQFFQTHSTDFEYQYYKDNSLRLINKELYDAKKTKEDNGTYSYQIIKPKKQLKIYKDKNSKEVAAVLKVGEKVKLIGYDEKNWVLVENSQGIRGWFEVNLATVKELNIFSGEAFEGLFFAG